MLKKSTRGGSRTHEPEGPELEPDAFDHSATRVRIRVWRCPLFILGSLLKVVGLLLRQRGRYHTHLHPTDNPRTHITHQYPIPDPPTNPHTHQPTMYILQYFRAATYCVLHPPTPYTHPAHVRALNVLVPSTVVCKQTVPVLVWHCYSFSWGVSPSFPHTPQYHVAEKQQDNRDSKACRSFEPHPSVADLMLHVH